MAELKITVPIDFSERDIKFLSEIWNNTDNSDLHIFAEEILKQCDKVSRQLNESAQKIMEANPFSKRKLGSD